MSIVQKTRRPAEAPAPRPRGVVPDRLACKPGTSRNVLRGLRAEDVALRHAYDRHTWLPVSVGLRAVPLVPTLSDIADDAHAAIAAANAVLDDLAAIVADLREQLVNDVAEQILSEVAL